MVRRTNPWPALVDLFSALLVAAFAGFILIASELKGSGRREATLQGQIKAITAERDVLADTVKTLTAQEARLDRLRDETDRIVKRIEERLARDQHLRAKVSRCGEDSCLDLFIHYPRNQARIPPEQHQQVLALRAACRTLREALDELPTPQRRDIEVIVEGHADRTQAHVADRQLAYLFNWSLSSQRAASVLYEFQDCGLAPPGYSVSMIGYADSERICEDASEDCDRRNRRTTLRLRANSQRIARRLESVATTP